MERDYTMPEIIEEDFECMKRMLDRIHEKSKTHLNKKEVWQYYQPVKNMIFECWSEITSTGISFTESKAIEVMKEREVGNG